jgi:UDP-N-acetylmuramate dehydrogenase
MSIQVQQNTELKHLTTYRTGGPARFFAEAKSAKDMFELREFAKGQGVPYLILGGGSNVLIADEGYPGLIIHNRMTKMQIQGTSVSAESGVNLMRMITLCADRNLGGISGLANVPGTIGGAVYGNAGIPDVYISDILTHAVVLPNDRERPLIVGPEYFHFGYRHSKVKETKEIILSATFQLKLQPAAKTQAEIREYIKARSLKQPAGFSCGSFFKNPGQFPSAGWLIERAGCKGLKVGGAQVSEKHANFIMNTGSATTTDIVELAKIVHAKVLEKFQTYLEPEVQILPVNPFRKIMKS